MKHLLLVASVFTIVSLAEEGWEVCGEDNEYRVFDGSDNCIHGGFDEAQQLCGEEGGELAILKDPDVAQCVMNINAVFQMVLLGLVPNNQSIIGFAWTDGTLVEDGYQNWLDGEPDNVANQQCVIIFDNSKQWKDDACLSGKHYACQRSTEIISTDKGTTNFVTNTRADRVTSPRNEPCICESMQTSPTSCQVELETIYIVIVVIVVVDLILIIIGMIFWMKKSNKFLKKIGKTSTETFNTSLQLSTRSQENLPSNDETNIDGSDEINSSNHTNETGIEVEERKHKNLNPALIQDNSSHHEENVHYINQSTIDKEKEADEKKPEAPYEKIA